MPGHADQAARVLPLAAAVRVLKARLARTGVPPASIDRQIGVNRTALSRVVYGKSWPAWDLVTCMAATLEALDAARDAIPRG